MRTHWIMTAGSIALQLAGNGVFVMPAAAQRQPSRGTIRYAEMDRDRDGVITRREWQGSQRDFQAADWNHDGVLSGDELRLDAPGDGQRPASREQRQSEFLRLDRNEDGLIARSEWKGIRSEFDDTDRNRDGLLTAREYVGADDRSRRNAAPDTRTVDVDARVRWVSAGIVVDKGDILTFNTDGTVQLSDDANDTAIASGSTSGRHAPDAPMPQELAGALIARIANSQPLGIGDQRQIIAPASGQLFFSVNDDHLADNRGRFRVRITDRQP